MERRTLERTNAVLDKLNADDLADLNSRRFNRPLPSPPSAASTRYTPDSEDLEQDRRRAAGVLDVVQRGNLWSKMRSKGMPHHMFELQKDHELQRFEEQRRSLIPGHGRRETVRMGLGLVQTNAAINIRQYWIEDGIWDEAWGSEEWPTDRYAEPRFFISDRPRPRPGLRFPTECWKHERPRLLREQKKRRNKRCRPRIPTPSYDEPSRPYGQFVNQVARERRWIKEDRDWKGLSNDEIDLDEAAAEAVRQLWRDNDLWQPQWGQYPGLHWRHELPEDDFTEADAIEAFNLYHEEQVRAPDDVVAQYKLATSRSRQHPQPKRKKAKTAPSTTGLRRSPRLAEKYPRRSSRQQEQPVATKSKTAARKKR